MGLHLRSRRLQSCSAAEASGGPGFKSPAKRRTNCPWRNGGVRSLGSSSSRSERPGDADDHRARRRNRLRRLGGRPRSRETPTSSGPDARKAMRSRAKEPLNSSTTGRSRIRLPKRRRSRPQSKTRPFFNTLLVDQWTFPAFVESVFDFTLPALRTEAG